MYLSERINIKYYIQLVTDQFLDEVVEDLCSELKGNSQKVHKDIETMEEDKNELKNKFTKLATDFSNLKQNIEEVNIEYMTLW